MPRQRYKLIPLRRRDGTIRVYVKVDASEYDRLMQWHWSRTAQGYAQRAVRLDDGRRSVILMHRELLGLVPGDGLVGDHVNGNRQDNRRVNLRILDLITSAQNVPARGGTSQYRGVHWEPRRRKWIAQSKAYGATYYHGGYDDEAEAARVADAFRRAHLPFFTGR